MLFPLSRFLLFFDELRKLIRNNTCVLFMRDNMHLRSVNLVFKLIFFHSSILLAMCLTSFHFLFISMRQLLIVLQNIKNIFKILFHQIIYIVKSKKYKVNL